MSNKLLWAFIHLMKFFLYLRLNIFAKITSFLIRIIFAAQIPPEVKIGKNTVFGYGGLSLVLHKDSVIGENCRLGSGVTLGSKNPDRRAPIIGDNCFIATGAKILGGVVVGKNSVVGANAVVTEDVPSKCIVVGIPAKVVKSNINIKNYNESFYS